MPAHQELAAKNASYVASFDKGDLALPPAKHYTVGESSRASIWCIQLNDISDLHGCTHRVRMSAATIRISYRPTVPLHPWVLTSAMPMLYGTPVAQRKRLFLPNWPLSDTLSSKEALRSIIISQRLLGTKEVAVFHHTDCGMLTFTNDDIRAKVKAEEPGNAVAAQTVDNIDFLTFPVLDQSVLADVEFLKNSKVLVSGTKVSGWIYDVRTGKVQTCLPTIPRCGLTLSQVSQISQTETI